MRFFMKTPKAFLLLFTFFIAVSIVGNVNCVEECGDEQQVQFFAQPRDKAGWDKVAKIWQSVKTFVYEKKLFIAEFWHNRHQVGSITPSSKYLAKAMTKSIKYSDRQTPLSILEVGAGTGIFTRYIINRMPVDSEFDVVEIDPKFCTLLTRNISDEFCKNEMINLFKVTFFCRDITIFDPGKKYDFIISGLPFHSFTPDLVRQILFKYVNLLKPGGTIVFFEYIVIQSLKKPFLSDEEQIVLEKIRSLINITKKLGKTREMIVWRNILPARVMSITID